MPSSSRASRSSASGSVLQAVDVLAQLQHLAAHVVVLLARLVQLFAERAIARQTLGLEHAQRYDHAGEHEQPERQ